jgi:hypothetical protein
VFPIRQHGRIAQELGRIGFVIALEIKHHVTAPACDQEIENLTRARTAIDVVAEEHLDRLRNRIGLEIGVDASKQRAQEVRSPVDVADGVDALAVGYARLCFLDLRSQHVPRQDVLQPSTIGLNFSGPR